MNKKLVLYTVAALSFAFHKSEAAMYGKILNLAKFTGASLSVLPFWPNAYKAIKHQPTIGYPMPDDVEAWAKNILEQCNDEKLNNLSLYESNDVKANWWTDYYSINAKSKTIKEIQKNLAIINNAPHDSSITDKQLLKAKKIIAAHEHFLKHEAGHNSLNHQQRNIAHNILVPLTVQAACSSATVAFNHVLKIAPPKTFLRTGARSFIALASCIPKIILSNHCIPDSIHYEKEADLYACDHARSILELQAARDFHLARGTDSPMFPGLSSVEEFLEHADGMSEAAKKSLSIGDGLDQAHATFDRHHPTPLARAHFIQEQIDQRKM